MEGPSHSSGRLIIVAEAGLGLEVSAEVTRVEVASLQPIEPFKDGPQRDLEVLLHMLPNPLNSQLSLDALAEKADEQKLCLESLLRHG